MDQLSSEFRLPGSAKAHLRELFSRLEADGWILPSERARTSRHAMLSMLGLPEGEGKGEDRLPSVAVVTDISGFKASIRALRYDQTMQTQIISWEGLEPLSRIDLRKSKSTQRYAAMAKLRIPVGTKAIGVFLRGPHPLLLRNLNTLFIRDSIPWILGIFDESDAYITSFIPGRTACYECLTLRATSAMESRKEFEKAENLLANHRPLVRRAEVTPAVNVMLGIAMNELLLFSSIGSGQLVGRLMQMSFASLEVRVNDLLRLPSCLACGAVSVTSKELYFDFQKVLADLVASRG